MVIIVGVLVLFLSLVSSALAQQPDMMLERFLQCQAEMRVKQETFTGTERIAAAQLVRAEKAEEQVKALQQKIMELSKPKESPEEKKD